MRVALIAKPGREDTGVGRYTSALRAALEGLGHEVAVVHPTRPVPGPVARAARRLLGWDLAAFFDDYPVWAAYPPADVYHLTSQNLATLLVLRRPPGPTVVTVHDVIPWLVRDDPALRTTAHRPAAWLDRLARAGLRRADGWVAVSAYSRQSLAAAEGA